METTLRSYALARGEGEKLWFLGAQTWVKATSDQTGGALGLIEQVLPAGFASPWHVHHAEDEAFYVVEGEMTFLCGNQRVAAGPGTWVWGPRDIPHGFRVEGMAPARLLFFATPAGFEQFVVELGEPTADWSSPPSAPPDMATLMAVAAKYRVDILGPLPDEAVPVGHATRGSSRDRERSDAMSGEENAAVVERWIEAYNARDTRAEAAARAPGFVAHVPGVPGPLDGDAWAGFIASFAAAFPDLRLTVEESFAAGDKVAARVTFRGTHRSEFQGIPPTDRQVTFSSIELNRMVGGKVAEHWVELDLLGLLRQLGAIPTPGTAGS